jgi:hypothetical protein
VINEADIRSFSARWGLSEMFRQHHIGEENVEAVASAQVGWSFFCYKCNQRFLRYGLIREEDFALRTR